MEKTLYLMRHGQTLFNLKGIIQGSCDSPLTKVGINQAKAAQQYFLKHHIKFDSKFSSTQERACDTLENVIPGESYQRLKGLKEWSFGMFEGESTELLKKIKQPGILYGNQVVSFGGEAKSEVEERVVTTLTHVMEQSTGTTLAVSHGSTITLFLNKFLEDKGKYMEIGNCNILKFKYNEGQFTFIEIINPIND